MRKIKRSGKILLMVGVPEARDAEIAVALDGASKEAGLSAEMSANLRRNVLGLRS